MDTQPVLNEEEAAKYLGVAQVTLAAWRKKNIGPSYLKYGWRLIRYRREDLDAFMAKKTEGNNGTLSQG
jgi:excisionase family DNA binding protein